LDVLQALIAPETRAIAVVKLNNPTVSCLNQQEFTELEAVCRRHNLVLIVEEVFSDFNATTMSTKFILNLIDFSVRYDNKRIENLNKQDFFNYYKKRKAYERLFDYSGQSFSGTFFYP
jgi:bifunctional pyridoxal-dependent enzyme with beta-cystathionase and maltose regulon repressor activities